MKIFKTNLEKLKMGCILRSIKKEIDEPANAALERASKELRFLQRQSEYAHEIERVLKELHLTVSLIKECKTGNLVNGFSRRELLAYHQGVFFTLVHQIKDKVIQLVHLMTEADVPQNPIMERQVTVSQLLRKKAFILNEIGIENDIELWQEENADSKIAVVLRKRTQHHHYISRIKNDLDYSRLGLADASIHNSLKDYLSDYGKEQIDSIILESTERLFSIAFSKAKDTLDDIARNIENISEALVKHFKLPIRKDQIRKWIVAYMDMFDSFEVKNKCSKEKIKEPFKTILEQCITDLKEGIISIYLVGSLGRGEFDEGHSDINIYIINNIDDNGWIEMEQEICNLHIFTKDAFLSDGCKKYRIIAKADGLLLHGEDLLTNDKLQASPLMALTLNEDIEKVFENVEKWIESNPNSTPEEISIQSMRLAKCFIDFIYGVVIFNKPQYTSSRSERVERIIEMFPREQKRLNALMELSRYGVGNLQSLKNMIEGFRPNAVRNLRKMQEYRINLEQQEEKQGYKR